MTTPQFPQATTRPGNCKACGGAFDDDRDASFGKGWLCSSCGYYRHKDRPRGERTAH